MAVNVTESRRAAVTARVEALGIVAVIRLKDPAKLRAVVDALADGGVRAPLPQVKLMPTGGVTLDNAGDWIRAGAVAVGLGSALLDAKAIDAGRFDVIADNARRVVANVATARRS